MAASAATRRSSGEALEAENARLRAELERLSDELARVRDSEAMYRASARISGRLVWEADADGRLSAISPLFETLTGVDPMEEWLAVAHPDDRDQVRRRWEESVRTGEPFVVEFRCLLASGATRMVLSRAVPVRDNEGHVQRWYGTTEDIEEEWQAQCARREALQRLRESEELHRFTVELTQQIVWSVEPDGTGLTMSQRYYELTGVDPDHDAALSVHPDERERVVSTWRACLGTGQPFVDECRLRMKDGSYRYFRLRGAPLRDADGSIVRWYGMTEDIHEERSAEAEIRRMQSELIHVSRLSAMGTMASALAHELNQPLAAVSNYLSGARRVAGQAGKSDALIEALSLAAAGTQRAGEIVRRLRELVARGAASVAAEHLPTMIDEAGVLGFVDAKLLGVRHRLKLDSAAQWVQADRVQIQQVLINLIRNAVEAMQHSRNREVVISTRAGEDGMIEVSVADSGPGIATEDMESLFSRFITTKSDGMGIGLPICRTIVEGHGGKIWAENRPEGGALFRFILPAADPPETA